jgi:rod shape determining protein RodA
MSFLEYRLKFAPTGFAKVFYVNWSLYLLICACATIGWLMLYSISGGDMQQWAEPQMKRFGVGMVLSLAICFTPIWFWRSLFVFEWLSRWG